MAGQGRLRTIKTRIKNVRNTDDRVKFIARNIAKYRTNAEIHTFAAQALTDFCGGTWCVQPRDWLGEVCAISEHIKNNVRYTLDTYGIDTYRTPIRTLQLAMGDCDDMAQLAGAMLQAVGYPVMIKVIQTPDQDDFNHIYIMAGMPPQNPKKFVAVDPSQPFGCGWEAEGVVRQKVYKVG